MFKHLTISQLGSKETGGSGVEHGGSGPLQQGQKCGWTGWGPEKRGRTCRGAGRGIPGEQTDIS